jgi:hypothetical protein
VPGTKPRLEVVEGGAGAAAPESPSSPTGPRSRARIVAWALAGLLALAVLGFAQQGRRAERLMTRVAGLEAELAASEAALQAHRSHLADVRGAVAKLQDLVEREPAKGPSAGAAAPR